MIPGRRFFLLPMLLAAVGAPFLLMGKDWRGTLAKWSKSGSDDSSGQFDPLVDGTGQAAAFGVPGTSGSAGGGGSSEAVAEPRLEGFPVADMQEVFRFDIAPAWVTSRWARVSTVRANPALSGLRVPLVTGTGIDDLAGSLTYYFDDQHQVQRITFQGTTGDARRLVAFLTQHFRFEPKPTLDAGMYVRSWNGRPTDGLRISYAPVILANEARSRLDVMLELNRPDSRHGISPEFQQLLTFDNRPKRW